jgi:hypothetical protein
MTRAKQAITHVEINPRLGRRRRDFLKFCKQLARSLRTSGLSRRDVLNSFRERSRPADRTISTTELDLFFVQNVLLDLLAQGWELSSRSGVRLRPPLQSENSHLTKEMVRSRHLLGRDAQLSEESVSDFLRSMERRRPYSSEWHSIYSLMRDGADLFEKLTEVNKCEDEEKRRDSLKAVIKPYIQFIENDERCQFTGLRLGDIWRYFRHTWVNEYKSVPGRSMMILIRDAAAQNHPVIGIAGLSSSVVQHRTRDEWIGWQSNRFVSDLSQKPTRRAASWALKSVQRLIDAIHLSDLFKDGVCSRSTVRNPNAKVIEKLLLESARAMQRHRLNPQKRLHKRSKAGSNLQSYWKTETRTHLYRSKRCRALASLLTMRKVFQDHRFLKPSQRELAGAITSPAVKASLARLVRMVKAEHVGVDMLDITVCGALAPYNSLLGGKLVCMLLCSPEVTKYYSKKYSRQISVIASATKGRPVIRKPSLVLMCTTSLYGVGSSQYNRVNIPLDAVGGEQGAKIIYENLGHSYGFGTYHFSRQTVQLGSILTSRRKNSRPVNSIFGEGVNPLMRKIREALDTLRLPSDELLQHGNRRVTYGIRLAGNFREILIGLNKKPSYLIPQTDARRRSLQITNYWIERWLLKRIKLPDVLYKVKQHTLSYPLHHGAMVALPLDGENDAPEPAENFPTAGYGN